MGKQGPCHHCGVTSTPLWRNGPPDKPVLCNACGSRWRTKGTLLNYTPLHARADPADYEEQRVARVKSISINKNKDAKVLKRKHFSDSMATYGGTPLDYNSGFSKYVEEDMSNRSSSGSAMSNSDVQFESADASDLTGPAQSVVWDSMVPSRKRTCSNRLKQSSVEKLTRDLHAIMHEQQSSCLSASSEEDLLLESTTPMCSFEIGHGTVLFRGPSSIAREEESEASSLSVDRNRYKASEGYSGVTNFSLLKGGKPVSLIPNPRMIKRPTDRALDQEHFKRDTSQHESLQIIRNHNSPLSAINPEEVVNVEEFMKCLTYEEEEQLLKYIPSGDKAHLFDSLRTLFGSSEFKENLSSCPQLLAEGFSGSSHAKAEDFKTLKKLVLFNLMKCKEVESHPLVEESRNSSKSSTGGLKMLQATASSTLVGGKRPRDIQNFSDGKVMTSPKRPGLKGGFENRETMDNEGSCFSPRSLFAYPPNSGSLMFDSSPFAEDNSDQDLLLNVPSNSSFPQAELLHPALSFGSRPHQASTSSSSVHQHAMHPR